MDIIDLLAAADHPLSLVGGKAWRLGLLAQLGLPTPDGFVISAPTMAAAHAAPSPSSTERLAATLKSELERRGWSTLPLAVRSSAPHEDDAKASFAGIYASRLNVIGPDAALHAAGEVWTSLWTPHARAYRQRAGLTEDEAAMAVLIMPLVTAKAAGVAFTQDPRSGRDDLMIINAVKGLGEALVGGSEVGEEIRVSEERITDRLFISARIPGQQFTEIVPCPHGGTLRQPLEPDPVPIMNDKTALDLAHLLREAAQALDYSDPAFDIEWVWTGARFVLVQARPITAQGWHTYPELAGQSPIWSNGNTRDVAPHVMGAMDWIGGRKLADLLLEEGYRRVGFPLLAGLRRSGLFGGRLYLNTSLIQWECYAGFGLPPKAMTTLLGGHQPEVQVPSPNWRDNLARTARRIRYILLSSQWRRQGLAEIKQAFAKAKRFRSLNLAALSDRELIGHMADLGQDVLQRPGMMFLQGSGGGTISQILTTIQKWVPEDAPALTAAITTGGEPSVSTRQGLDMVDLARLARDDAASRDWLLRGPPWDMGTLPTETAFQDGLAQFIETYGHRGIYETYLRNKRFREDPSYVLASIAALLPVDTTGLESRQNAARNDARKRLDKALPFLTRLMLRAMVEPARMEGRHRELARSALIAINESIRLLLLEIGRRLRARGVLNDANDVFDLTPHEARAALSPTLAHPGTDLPPQDAIATLAARVKGLRQRIRHRRRQMALWDAQPAADIITDGRQAAAPPPPVYAGPGKTGVSVGCGVVEGIARIIRSPEEGDRLQPGDILVAPSTDPAWTPMFLRAGGLIMETGGYLSHGAIIARELGIPAVINLPGILNDVRDGQRVRVDGNRGEVILL